MPCRALRGRSWREVIAALVVCLALIGGLATLPPAWPEDEIPSLTPATHAVPLSAIAEGSGVRMEKQAQSHRLFIKKPERSVRPSRAEQTHALRPRRPTPQAPAGLPRRHLYAARSRPGSPDDPSASLLS